MSRKAQAFWLAAGFAAAMPWSANAQGDSARHAQAAVVSSEQRSLGIALDPDGTRSRAEAIEQMQRLLWEHQDPPRASSDGALSASIAQIIFGAMAGGGGAGQDLVRPAE